MENLIENNYFLLSLYNDYLQNKRNKGNLKNNKNKIINNNINNNSNNINNDNNKINNDNNINNDFYKIISEQMTERRKNSVLKFSKCIKDFNDSYTDYKNKILKYIEKININFSKLKNIENDEAFIKYATKNVFKKLDYLKQIYESIVDNIIYNFELLYKFLKQELLIEQNNPIEYFLNQNYEQIFNCALINKINYESSDISKVSNNNYLDFFYNKKRDISFRKCAIFKNYLRKGKEFISEYYHLLNIIEMNNINSNDLRDVLNEVYNNQEKNKSNVLKKIILNNCDLIKEIKNIEFIQFNKIEELKIKSSCLNIKFIPDLFLANTTNLKSLSLEKVNMSNLGLNKLFEILPKYFKSLEYLSLAKNSITEVKNIFNTEENITKSFSNLKYFSLHKNSIYYFGFGLDKFPKMKLLDLTSNSFNNECIMKDNIKAKNNLVLFNDNIFISNCEENNITYIDYLTRRLKDLKFGLKILHLCFTYDEKTQTKLKKLQLSPNIKVSLIKLDLSFCGLKTDTVIKFLKKNYGLFSLKVLDLKYNNIESDIFEEFVRDDEINLEKLTTLNLSENHIECQKYEENEYLIKFIEKYEKLKVIRLYYCPFFSFWNKNISPDVDTDGKLKNLYRDFKRYLDNKRKFIFIIDNNSKYYVEKEFADLFKFK